MPAAGSISPSGGDKVSNESWEKILADIKGFAAIKSADVMNPMTGDRVPMTNPPNKLAEFTVDGDRKGIIWLPSQPFELGFEGEGSEFESAMKSVAEIVGGEITSY